MMRNLVYITIAMLMLNYETCAKDYWADMGVTCEKEKVRKRVCGGQFFEDVHVCRGTCRSLSRITMSSWDLTVCTCCRAVGFLERDRECNDGTVEKIKDAEACVCSRCY